MQVKTQRVSILMLTHNAPLFVELAIRSLGSTKGVDYEVIVVDNASDEVTKENLWQLREEGLITKVKLLEYNSLFAGGNNIAARETRAESSHFLLINSDVEIKDPNWLSNLLAVHRPGITSYGVVENPLRVDGYCLLVDAQLYLEHMLDEDHQWFWAITKLQATLLSKGYSVQGYAEHEKYLHHFGGKSGRDYKGAKGLTVSSRQLEDWFQGRTIRVLDSAPDGSLPKRPRKPLVQRGFSRLQRLAGW
jgi:glycosyltransferase involved in cell wall biosynthesis